MSETTTFTKRGGIDVQNSGGTRKFVLFSRGDKGQLVVICSGCYSVFLQTFVRAAKGHGTLPAQTDPLCFLERRVDVGGGKMEVEKQPVEFPAGGYAVLLDWLAADNGAEVSIPTEMVFVPGENTPGKPAASKLSPMVSMTEDQLDARIAAKVDALVAERTGADDDSQDD